MPITGILLAVQALIWGAVSVAIVFLIRRRLKIKKAEKFEKRDN